MWHNMRARCSDPKRPEFGRYGGRGIQVHQEWLDYPTFRAWALGHGYQPGLTIERIDNDGDYCPENCTWVTTARQNRNKRNSRILTAYGETKCLADWAEDPRCVVSFATAWARLRLGWSSEAAISEPAMYVHPSRQRMVTAYGETKCVSDWAGDPRCVVGKSTLHSRLRKLRGWEPTEAISTPVRH